MYEVIDTNDFDNILSLTGPKYFSSKLFEWIKNNSNDKVVIFPTTFFYPFPAKYRHMIRIDNEDSRKLVQIYNSEKSYCTHLWYTSWQK